MTDTLERIARFASDTTFQDLPPDVAHEAKRVLLDSLGCAVAGLDSDKGDIAVRVATRLGGPPESSIAGSKHKVSAAGAAFANGETINALDFDAILRPAVHITPWVIPAAIALCESLSRSGRDLLTAVVLGHEISNRLARALSPKRDVGGPVVSGYSFNALSSAAVAAKVLELDAKGIANAVAIAGYNAPMQSFTQWERSGTSALIKYGSAGWVAQTGVTSALLAQEGYTGDLGLLEGEYGFWRYSGAESWRPKELFDGLGQTWEILDVRYKRYPCCGITHSSLDAFTALMDENRFEADDLEEVRVWLDPAAELPLWQDRTVENEVHAQFSVAYDIAVAAHRLDLNWQWLRPETRKNPRVLAFMDRVKVLALPEYRSVAAEDPTAQMARVEVRAGDTTLTRENRYASGRPSPERPGFSDRYLEEKFYHNTSSRLTREKIGRFIAGLWEMEKSANVSELLGSLTPG